MINVAIIGYGNLGKGVEIALQTAPDMQLFGIFTRRSPKEVETLGGTAYQIADLLDYQAEIDVAILCGGSATDLPEQSPVYAQYFHIVDSFDTHAEIPTHFARVDEIAANHHKVAIISAGWDPGLFSLQRVLAEAFLPIGKTETFWGKGVSQGHSDAIRRIAGVRDATQYTIPKESVLQELKTGKVRELSAGDKHLRECYVVLEPEADAESIRAEIQNMPNYFAEYETLVHFISQSELEASHKKMAHGGEVVRIGQTGVDSRQVFDFSLELASNPEFTGSILLAYARAAVRLAADGKVGAKTVFDIAPKYLATQTNAELRRSFL